MERIFRARTKLQRDIATGCDATRLRRRQLVYNACWPFHARWHEGFTLEQEELAELMLQEDILNVRPVRAAPPSVVGRPTRGLVGEMATRALLRALPPYQLDELAACCALRQKRGRWAAMHDDLAIAIATISFNHGGLAEILGCSRRTIERLHTKGVELTTQERIAVALERQAEATERLAEAVELRWPTPPSIADEVDQFIASALDERAA